MLLYNTLTRQKEAFSVEKGPVTIYVCGVTPYDTTHLGHAFTYVFFDTLIRYLRFQGHATRYVQNVTDVDDDIMRKSRELGTTWDELAERETRLFQQDMAALNVLAPDVYPRASEEIEKILDMTKVLLARGLAYQSNGNVYFQVSSDPKFGSLSGMPMAAMLPVANQRGNNPDDPLKKDPLDFVLWQKSAPGEPSWNSPWGPGRPGWHIECSAMSLRYLGDVIDIHGGGEDLVFPHHECEIVQSENYTGKRPFVRFWVHTAMVRMNGEKMSKSLGNLVMVRRLLDFYTSDAIRLLLLNHHHTDSWTYIDEEMEQAATLAAHLRKASTGEAAALASPVRETEAGASFLAAMDNDLDTPGAVGTLSEVADEILEGGRDGLPVPQLRSLLRELSGVLGLTLK